MNFADVMIVVSICTAIFGCYCATRKRSRHDPSKSPVPQPSEVSKIRRLMPGELEAWCKLEPHHRLIRVRDAQGDVRQNTAPWKDKGISVEELERCIPWIPRDEKIVVCCAGGSGESTFTRLDRLRVDRDIYLVESASGAAPVSR
jgi:protein-tyrosine phosphatase